MTSRTGLWAYVAMASLALAFMGYLSLQHPALLAPYFGDVEPLLVLTGLLVLGGLSLRYLSRYGMIGRSQLRLSDLAFSSALAFPFALIVIGADHILRWPPDINVALPEAVPFYFAMAVVVEMAFHVIPFAALAVIHRHLKPLRPTATLLVVALIEPVFQISLALGGDAAPAMIGFLAAHLLIFNVTQLWLFRRFGFAAMLVFRLTYYAAWHIAWGHIRLDLFFGG